MDEKEKKKDYLRIKRQARFFRRLYTRLVIYGLILVILSLIDYLSKPESWWVHWIALGLVLLFILIYLKNYLMVYVFNNQWERRFVRRRFNDYGDK